MALNLEDVMSILPTAMHQSIPIEDLELAAVSVGINPVEEFMQSMADKLRIAGTSEEAIAKMKQEFDPRTSGCYREYLRRDLIIASQNKKEIYSKDATGEPCVSHTYYHIRGGLDDKVADLVTAHGKYAVQEALNRVECADTFL
jgi:hypothetical protein